MKRLIIREYMKVVFFNLIDKLLFFLLCINCDINLQIEEEK